MLLAGCRQQEFGPRLSSRQAQEVNSLADEQIRAQYRPAVDSSAGYVAAASAFAVLARNTESLPPGAQLRFTVLDTPEQFAISLPDGHLYFASGLLRELADDPGQEAALVAHQIGHVAAKHDAINLEAALGQAEMVNMLDQGKYQDVVNTELQLQRLSYTNEQEYQADRTAVRLLARSGYDASELSKLVAHLASLSAADQLGTWTESHPVSKSRISRINDAVAALAR